MTGVVRKDCWPTPEQELVLRAALLTGEEAVQAWQEWAANFEFDRISNGVRRLLPLAHHHLRGLGVEHPLLRKIGGIRRFTWCENQVIFHTAGALLRALDGTGIPTMVLKGAPLALLHYRDASLRPMRDVDVLVPPDETLAAISVLRDLGWAPKMPWPEDLAEQYVPTRHAHGFKNGGRHELDLHSFVLAQSSRRDADAAFWREAVPVQVDGMATRALDSTSQLLHVCVHAASWAHEHPVHWVADSVMVLRGEGPIDWDRFVRQAREHAVVLPLRERLRYLRAVLDAPIPGEVLVQLDALEVKPRERRDHALLEKPLALRGPFGMLQYYRREYERWKGRENLNGDSGGFLRYMQHYWALRHPWQLPLHLLFRTARKTLRTNLARLRSHTNG
ncbi:MAG: nucleotidyltransferase family protein [Candidatus Hydrogenedentes bacterium]|nr:nucleotidyltransferase family protein [Candidatus Hydrogenedentota bacterium]